MKIRAIVVDGHASVRQMLVAHLQRCGVLDVVGEAGTGPDAVSLCRRTNPSLVLTELCLPELDGVAVKRQLQRDGSRARLLYYSGATHRELVLEALREQPHGFVHKEDPLSTLMEAIQAIARGASYFSPFATEMKDRLRSPDSSQSALTGRERSVLQLVAQGRSNKEIAEKLGVSSKTVEYHRGRLMTKLDAHDVATLTCYALRIGLIAG
jgi:DNA-binding NarL/FixJ family response regulator